MQTLLKMAAKTVAVRMRKAPTIQEIHDSFEIATQKAVEEAKGIIESSQFERIKERASILRSLGFTSMPEVEKFKQVEREYKRAQNFIDLCSKYENKYPQYKFITLEDVIRICKKYNLCCAPVSRYEGNVPDKNVKEMADFKVLPEDVYYERWSNRDRQEDDITDPSRFFSSTLKSSWESYRSTPVSKFICAPLKDFKFTQDDRPFGEVFVTRFIEDPIVLHYVKDGFLIVSKWGEEANDPILTNQKMN